MFRHTYITFLLQRGVDPSKIRRLVGHSSTQLIDRVYGHLLEGDLGFGRSSTRRGIESLMRPSLGPMTACSTWAAETG